MGHQGESSGEHEQFIDPVASGKECLRELRSFFNILDSDQTDLTYSIETLTRRRENLLLIAGQIPATDIELRNDLLEFSGQIKLFIPEAEENKVIRRSIFTGPSRRRDGVTMLRRRMMDNLLELNAKYNPPLPEV